MKDQRRHTKRREVNHTTLQKKKEAQKNPVQFAKTPFSFLLTPRTHTRTPHFDFPPHLRRPLTFSPLSHHHSFPVVLSLSPLFISKIKPTVTPRDTWCGSGTESARRLVSLRLPPSHDFPPAGA